MAGLDEMKVKISADISDLISKLDKGGISLDQFAKQTTAISSRIGKDVSTGSNQAATALQNLGRVAQDAPFGFIGIQNNINPLLESFQRLKAETGSASGAFKALGASLVGAGGLGLAVSVATGILTVLASNGFFKTEKAADTAKNKIEEYKETISNIFSDAAKEATQVQSLVAVLESETATRKRKLAAIKELQGVNPELFAGLKLEGNLVTGLGDAYKSYLDNIKTVIAVKIKQQQLEDVTKKILEKQGVTLTGAAKTLRDILKTQEDINIARVKDNANAPVLAKRVKDTNELNSLQGQSLSLIKEIGELSQGVDIKASAFNEKKVTTQRTYLDVLKDLNEELALNNKLGDIGFLSSQEVDESKIAKTRAAIESILKLKKGPGVNSPIITNLIASIEPEEARTQLLERLKEVVKTVRPSDIAKELPQVVLPLNLRITADTKRAISRLDQEIIDEFNKTAATIEKGVLTGGFSKLGETIGAAIGGGDVADAFRGLLDTVLQGMKSLGEAMIGLGTAKIALEKFNLAPGIGTVVAGIGVIALSSLIQSALPKFADGVTGFGGGYAMVGERGPEIVRLPQGSDVIPNHRLNGITGGMNHIEVTGRIVRRGADELILISRAQQQSNRRG